MSSAAADTAAAAATATAATASAATADTTAADDAALADLSSAEFLEQMGVDWRSFADDDVKDDLKALESVKDLPALIKTAVHGQKALGSAIRLPGKDAKPEDIAKLKGDAIAKLQAAGLLDGAPTKPEEYTIERPDFAAAVGWDDDAEAAFRTEMHKAGATNAQVQAAINAYTAFTLRGIQAEKTERDRVQAELQKEWGPNFKPNVGLANKAVQTLDAEIGAKGELIGYLQTVGAADHPLMVKAMAWMGKSMWEHGVIDGVAGEVGVEEAKSKLSAMESDRNSALNQRTHPDHRAAVEEALALGKLITRGGR